MDVSPFITAISSVGFPIVMCLIMVYLNKEQDEKHEREMKELSKAVENNTLVMTQILDKLNS